MFPVAALIGVPAEGSPMGEIVLDGERLPYYWHRGLRKSADDPGCPFLLYDAEDKRSQCKLVGSSEHWRWVAECQEYPDLTMSDWDAEEYERTNPHCGYRWRRKEDKVLHPEQNESRLEARGRIAFQPRADQTD